ncbi:MAG: phospholipid carrier-dependent glycosyltransferase, partial [Anaerolineales bacterium]
MWVYRSIRFLSALLRGDLAGTLLVGHPGVITMMCGSLGIAVRRFLFGAVAAEFDVLSQLPALMPDDAQSLRMLAAFLPAAKLPMALLNAVCILAIYLLLKKLVSAKAALLAAVLLGLDPFHIALSRVLHIDAATANLMMCSLLALLVSDNLARPATPVTQSPPVVARRLGLPRATPRSWLILSGVFAGLALLAKSYAVFLVPFTGLLLIVSYLAKGRSFRDVILAFAAWCAGAAATFVLLWPAMWVNPIGTLQSFLGTAFGYAAVLSETPGFFLGRAVEDPGAVFYVVALAFRTTPLAWLGLAMLLIVAVQALRKASLRSGAHLRPALASQQLTVLALVAYTGLFVALLALATKKFDRYMLPPIVALDILAGLGLARLIERIEHRATALILATALLAQAAFVASHHPYYLAYYNPLVGGSSLAPQVMPLGWGEGLDLAADYLNRKPNAEQLSVAT